MKRLNELSLNLSEDEYRSLPALHHSALATYNRKGFDCINTLFEPISSPSLTFGSMVDILLTGNKQLFNEKFYIAENVNLGDKEKEVVEILLQKYSNTISELGNIPIGEILEACNTVGYQSRWKPETRVTTIMSKCDTYYTLSVASQGKTIISQEDYDRAMSCVNSIMINPALSPFFSKKNTDSIEHFYQLQFQATFDDIDYIVMLDSIVVNHKEKVVYPVDLKTSSYKEWNFMHSFIQYGYDIQARLYWRVLSKVLSQSKDYKDYTVAPFCFIVVNKDSLIPLLWKWEDSDKYGDLIVGKNNDIILRDPFDLGKELKKYLDEKPAVPEGINRTSYNNLTTWLSKY